MIINQKEVKDVSVPYCDNYWLLMRQVASSTTVGPFCGKLLHPRGVNGVS